MQESLKTPLISGVYACVSWQRMSAVEVHQLYTDYNNNLSWMRRTAPVSLMTIEWALDALVKEKLVCKELTIFTDQALTEDTYVYFKSP
ncbi:MAG: hypothetical protein RIQ41_46 [Candidatus Parcubacteria bacterium]|jgi:hypothetical protein